MPDRLYGDPGPGPQHRTMRTGSYVRGKPGSIECRPRDFHQPLPNLLLLAHIRAVFGGRFVRDRREADRLHALPEIIRPDDLRYGAMQEHDAALGRTGRRIDRVPALHIDVRTREQLAHPWHVA